MNDLLKSRLTVICGYYGSGKTNIAVNLAFAAAAEGKKTVIVDLDIVNPYFRTADNVAELTERGITPLIPEFANTNVDIPSLPPAFPTVFEREETVIIDVGGGADGAGVLRGYREDFERAGYALLYVFNACRPENTDVESALCSMAEIAAASGLTFSGIVNNTHLCGETTAEVVQKGISLARTLAQRSGLPLLATTAFEKYSTDVTVIADITKKLF